MSVWCNEEVLEKYEGERNVVEMGELCIMKTTLAALCLANV